MTIVLSNRGGRAADRSPAGADHDDDVIDLDAVADAPADPPSPPPGPRGASADVAVLSGLALVVWAATIAVARAWALFLDATGHQLVLFTPPVLGGYRLQLPDRFWVPVAVAIGAVVGLPVIARRLRWTLSLLGTTVVAAAWWISLAMLDGRLGFTQGLEWDRDYAATVSRVGADPFGWLRGFVGSVPGETIQVRAHPPGFPFLMGLLDRVGLGTETVAVVLIIVVALSSIAAVAIAVRELAGEDVARRVLPFLALAPLASWAIISTDALYMGVAAWMVALFVLATGRRGRRMVVLAIGAGALAAVVVVLSYGLVLMAGFVALAAWHRRRWQPLVVAGATAAAALVALVPLGFWWFDGLEATKTAYYALGLDRPYDYSLIGNLAALALVVGPATFVGLARLRDRRLWVLVGGGLVAVVVADVSGLSKLEVERIWLPFAVWLLVATAALGRKVWSTRLWLAVQGIAALVLTALVSTYW